jgi:hypothetical protein
MAFSQLDVAPIPFSSQLVARQFLIIAVDR